MRYLKYFALVVLLGVGLLDLVYIMFRKGYNRYNEFEQARLNTIINGTDRHDALFIGSSRTFYHVNPAIIDSVMHLDSYNAGIDGANLLETNLILHSYLESHPSPKLVVADLSTPAFDIREASIHNPNIYYPFLDNNLIYNFMKPYKRVELLKYLPFLQITECDDFLRQGAIAGLIGKRKPLEPNYKGYLQSGVDTIPLPFRITYLTTNYPVKQQGKDLLVDLINTCRLNHIRLVITYSPVFDEKDEYMNPAFFPTLKRICDSTGTPFLNYRNIALSCDNRMFRDELHLNRQGADVFSELLAHDLQKLVHGSDSSGENDTGNKLVADHELKSVQETVESIP